MLHAKTPDGFFDFGNTGLDGDACALILKRMDDDVCGRFLGNPTVGYEYSETTAAHEVRTYETVEKIIDHVVTDPAEHYAVKNHYKAMIMLHDVSDVLKEVIVASTEVDPVLKAQCANNLRAYDLAVTPFIYKLALFAVADKSEFFFDTMVNSLREELIAKEQHARSFSMGEANAFCDATVSAIEKRSKDFNSFIKWNAPGVDQKINVMMQYYNEIEQTSSFAGLQSQIHEKSDGTQYAASVSIAKNNLGKIPTHYHVKGNLINRLHGRYEKNLSQLTNHAETDQQKALAACTLHHCYDISQTVYALSKDYICLSDVDGEPGELDAPEIHAAFNAQQKNLCEAGNKLILPRNALVDLYSEAKYDLVKHGILWLPEENKTLAESQNVQRIKLNNGAIVASAAYLHNRY